MPYTADWRNIKSHLMNLKTKYILFLVLIHLLCLVLSYVVFRDNKLLFILSELLVLISVLLSMSIYRQLIRPFVYLKEGVNAIKDRDFNVKFRPTGKPEMDELIGVYNQMMDELRIERTKQEEQHFFLEKLIHTSPTGIVILDYDHQIKQINPKAASLIGAEPDLFIRQFNDLKPGHSRVLKTPGLATYKIQKSHFIDRGFSRVFILIEELTAEIFEAEKKVYDKVIRMMAHEVNNTIGPVNSILSLTLDHRDLWKTGDKSALKNALQVALERNQNLNLFVRNFADLVKLSPVNKQQFDVLVLLRSVADFMQIPAEKKGVVFEFDFPAAPFYLSADLQQMEQVLINILKNSMEAMDGAGVISFLADQKERKLVISDNGRGISTQTGEQLFVPFFTTKKDGQGIGLTLVREVLLNHGFEFSLSSPVPGRTDFVIFLH
ncbi:PAS domain-containing protein [Pedobacter nutrimenti]|uniref:histidine kinase n=2 Tax=Pedobacter nutrimenti TaxID=1241337 RepID=A0A318UBJ9_9SPHI|nr:PAS domain-containing protein [Pedobacter nutrimenti]